MVGGGGIRYLSTNVELVIEVFHNTYIHAYVHIYNPFFSLRTTATKLLVRFFGISVHLTCTAQRVWPVVMSQMCSIVREGMCSLCRRI